MKKTMLLTLAVCVAFSFSAFASNSTTVTGWVTDPSCGAKHNKEGGEACVKSCSERAGGKLAFVTDGDSKVWAVENSDALKGHEGHHVKVTGTPNADKGTIKVETVAMLDSKNEKAVGGDEHKGKHKGEMKKEEKSKTKEEKKG
jgi:hypothetical protein